MLPQSPLFSDWDLAVTKAVCRFQTAASARIRRSEGSAWCATGDAECVWGPTECPRSAQLRPSRFDTLSRVEPLARYLHHQAPVLSSSIKSVSVPAGVAVMIDHARRSAIGAIAIGVGRRKAPRRPSCCPHGRGPLGIQDPLCRRGLMATARGQLCRRPRRRMLSGCQIR